MSPRSFPLSRLRERAGVRALWAALALLLASGSAWADGAFPDELRVFVPAAFPHRIVLATNFGLVISEDDGQSWRFVCESYLSTDTFAFGYQQGPDGDLYALVDQGLNRSGDEGCTWQHTGTPGGAAGIRDLFPDPAVPGRVAVLTAATGGARTALFVSTDGARSFGAAQATANDEDWLGVEYAASEPGRLYVTGDLYPSDGGPKIPVVRAQVDGGWSAWFHPEYANDLALLAQVDPSQPDALYLRLVAPDNQDLLGQSLDQGQTLSTALTPGTSLSAFLRASDGTLYAGTREGSLWRRTAGSPLWVKLTGPHLRCLGERGGRLYACGDPQVDGYALAVSDDQGSSFTPLLRFGDIAGPLTCLSDAGACDDAYALLLRTFPPDAGLVDAGPGPAPDAGPAPTPAPKGCGCQSADLEWSAALLALLAARWRRSRSAR